MVVQTYETATQDANLMHFPLNPLATQLNEMTYEKIQLT